MAMGFAIQFKNGQDVLMRIYPDVHLKGGNINLERAKQLNSDYVPKTKTFYEDSNLGVMQGKITIVEQR